MLTRKVKKTEGGGEMDEEQQSSTHEDCDTVMSLFSMP